MPSVNTKTEKIPNSEASDPLRQAIVIVEHKIRNLEKRKAKLDSYKDSGKPLTREQVEALSKYEEVLQQLELSREYVKQFTIICVFTDKLRKKALKKEALERTAAETAKIKQVLLIQDVLQNMGVPQTREDFLAGQNGALTLTAADLKCLDDLYAEVSPKHEGPVPFNVQVQKAAENFMAITDGRGRELVGSTGVKLQELVASIQGCGYFEQPEAVPEPEEVQEAEQVPEVVETQTLVEELVTPMPPPPQEAPITVQQPLPPNIPTAAPMHALLQNIVPVSQVESSLFNAQGFQPPNNTGAGPAPPVVRNTPLNDVMSRVGGNFTFFQESELDSEQLGVGAPPLQASQPPLQPPAAIPSRTFTNQSFNGQPAPAPMGYPPAPNASPYFVGGGYQPQGPPLYSQDMMQPYPVAGNNALPPMQAQRPTEDNPTRGFPQPPQHIGNAYAVPQSTAAPTGPAPAQAPAPQTYQLAPVQPAPAEEPIMTVSDENKVEEPRQDWAATDRLDWSSEDFAEWNPQGTEGNKNSGASKPRGERGDRPRSNYQGNRNNSNRNNYSNNRPGNRDRDNGNNNGNYYNNHNGYQRDSKDREYQPRGERGDKGDVNGGYGGYRRGGPPRGPRPDRQDRPQQGNSVPRNNTGPRPPRNNNRGPPGQHSNNYRQEDDK